MCGLPLLLLAISQGQQWGWLSWRIVAAAALGALLLAVFVSVELRRAAPLLDFGLFRSRVFTDATLSALGNCITLFVPIILLPFYFIEALGMSASRTSLLLSAQRLMMALVASPSGRLSDRIGTRGWSTGGLLVLAAGVAGGVMAVARSLGMSVGVAAATSVYLAAGGETGRAWVQADFAAFRTALRVAMVVCLLSAAAAALRGRSQAASPS